MIQSEASTEGRILCGRLTGFWLRPNPDEKLSQILHTQTLVTQSMHRAGEGRNHRAPFAKISPKLGIEARGGRRELSRSDDNCLNLILPKLSLLPVLLNIIIKKLFAPVEAHIWGQRAAKIVKNNRKTCIQHGIAFVWHSWLPLTLS